MSSIESIIKEFQESLLHSIKFSYSGGKSTLGKPGIANRLFCFALLQDKAAFIDFLQKTEILKREMKCDRCNGNMMCAPKTSVQEGLHWSCRNHVDGKMCKRSKSIRHNTLFSCSKLKFEEIFLITYEIVRGTKTGCISEEYDFASHTMADWRTNINKIILHYIMSQSERIGGVEKTVELCESKLGKRNNRGDAIDGQWVMGGVEKESGKVFLVAVTDGTAPTLISTIKQWIEPGTTVCSDDWKTYNICWKESYIHLTYNHNLSFKDSHIDCNNLATQSSWRNVKNAVPSGNCQNEFQMYMAMYLFRKSCFERQIDTFNKFLEVTREVNWDEIKLG